jgi:hypothetical protein
MKVEDIARVCHEANKAYSIALGDKTEIKSWSGCSKPIKDSAIAGVELHQSQKLGPEESHEAWMTYKINQGWKYGPEKSASKKEHPCLVPYSELPPEQKVKDVLFKAIVDALS